MPQGEELLWRVPLSEHGEAEARKASPYCGRYYYDGAYRELSEPLWSISSSVWRGQRVRMEIPMRGNVPFLWRDHYVTLVEEIEEAGMDKFSFATSDTLLRYIEVLASKNHYPQNSIMEVVVWTEATGLEERTSFAIFQKRLNHRAFDIVKGEALHLTLEDGEEMHLPGRHADIWGIGASIEALAHKKALQMRYDGACVVNADGRIARTSLGNIYTVMTESRIYGVSVEGGARRDPVEASLMRIIREESLHYVALPGLDKETMEEAVGCFVVSSALGLRPVVSAGTGKRYYTDMAYRLADRLRSLFIF